jgi:hypothetical protein
MKCDFVAHTYVRSSPEIRSTDYAASFRTTRDAGRRPAHEDIELVVSGDPDPDTWVLGCRSGSALLETTCKSGPNLVCIIGLAFDTQLF